MPPVDDCMRALREAPVPAGPGAALDADTVRALRRHEQAAGPRYRRIHYTRWAAAAVIAVVAVGAYVIRGSAELEQLALADVTQRTLQTQTVVFQFREHWGTARVMVKAGDGMRLESDTGDVMIVDQDAHRALMLDAREHSARLVPAQAWTGFDIYSWLRDLPSGGSRCIGNNLVDGRTALGFRVTAPIPATDGSRSAEFVVWVDAPTGLPVRIDRGETTDDERAVAWDIRFDVPLDDGLFELAIPEGYALQPPTAGAGSPPAHVEPPGGADDGKRETLAAGQSIRAVPVGRSVAEFTDVEDFSTPQAAYANINRACVAATNNAWARVSASSLRDAFPPDDEPAYTVTPAAAAMWRSAEIVEVLYCGDETVAVVARLTQPTGEHQFDLRSLTLEDGRWLNTGEDLLPTATEARERFAERCR